MVRLRLSVLLADCLFLMSAGIRMAMRCLVEAGGGNCILTLQLIQLLHQMLETIPVWWITALEL